MRYLAMTFAIACFCSNLHAQGTVLFDNGHLGGPNAPVYEANGVTKCSGPQFLAQLLAGPSVDNLATIAMVGFSTGNGAGYFYGGGVAIPSVVPGATAWVRVDVWNTASGPSFDLAKASGLPDSWWQSSTFPVVTGGSGSGVPSPPTSLLGLGTSPVYLNGFVPEPSTFALAGLGATAVLFRFRQRSRAARQPKDASR